MEIVTNENAKVGKFVAELVPGIKSRKDWGRFTAIGFRKNDELVAGVVFTAYTGHDVTISIAAKRKDWASRELFEYLAKLVFVDWGCISLTAITAKKAKHARQFIERNGFKLWGVKPKGYDGRQDAIYYTLLKEECTWLRHVPTNKIRQDCVSCSAETNGRGGQERRLS